MKNIYILSLFLLFSVVNLHSQQMISITDFNYTREAGIMLFPH